eukprot:gene41530-3298_t
MAVESARREPGTLQPSTLRQQGGSPSAGTPQGGSPSHGVRPHGSRQGSPTGSPAHRERTGLNLTPRAAVAQRTMSGAVRGRVRGGTLKRDHVPHRADRA